MNSRAYAPFAAATVVAISTLVAATSSSAHTGDQVFDTLESIVGESSDLSVPAIQYVSLELDLTKLNGTVYTPAPIKAVVK